MAERRNVIIFVLDSLRKDRLSPYNSEVEFTPNFQKLAEESEVFEEAYAQAPWTLPSTASMLTGLYPLEHKANHSKTTLDTEDNLLPELFSEEDYRTVLITPNTWLSPSIGTTEGFDEVENFLGVAGKGPVQTFFRKSTDLFNFLPEKARKKVAYMANIVFERFTTVDLCKSRETVDRTKQFIENSGDEEFFLFVNLMSAHEPYDPGDPPEKYLEKHGVKNIGEVPSTEREFFNDGYDKEDLKKAYDAAVDYTDDLVGELMDCIEEQGLEENTVIVVLGDHGQAAGDEGIYGHQFTVMDSVVETPLMIKGPDNEGTVNDLFELKELYSVVPGLAGIQEIPEIGSEEVKGSYEFPEFFVGVIPSDRREEFDRKFRFIKDEDTKIVKSVKRSGEAEYKAFNSDKDELDITDAMKRRVDNIWNEKEEASGSSKDSIDDEKVKKRLEDLGYM